MKKFFFLLLLLVLLPSVLGLRISGRVLLPYEPGETFEEEVCIIPEGVLAVKLTPMGVLENNIEIEEPEVDLRNGPVCIPYKVKLPNEFEQPGMQKSQIRVTERTPSATATISAVVSIGHQIWVDVPYPGKYLEMKLYANNAEAGEIVRLEGLVVNKGKQTINLVKGNIDVYNWNDELLGTVKTNELSDLPSQESGYLKANWSSGENTVGDYNAVLRVNYDGIKDDTSTRFKLGSLEIRMANYTREVYKGGIVPFYVKAESYWSEAIKGINAFVTVFNGSEKKGEFQTLSIDLAPWQKRDLLGYVDTNTLPLGNYDLVIQLNYGETRTYNGTLAVVEKPVVNIEEPKEFDSTKLLLMSTILLSLIALVLIVILIVSSRKKKV